MVESTAWAPRKRGKTEQESWKLDREMMSFGGGLPSLLPWHTANVRWRKRPTSQHARQVMQRGWLKAAACRVRQGQADFKHRVL